MHGTLKGSDRQDRFFWNQKSQYSVNSKKKKERETEGEGACEKGYATRDSPMCFCFCFLVAKTTYRRSLAVPRL